MLEHFQTIKGYLLELDYLISSESEDEQIIVIENENMGIKNTILSVDAPILVVEQHIFDITNADISLLTSLLKKNREIIHGAFVLDETGTKVIFRNTHELDNLDLNELEATLNSLGILMNEYSTEILAFSKQ